MNEKRLNMETIKKYLLNCFLLMLPILLWNIVLTSKLPQAFQPDVFWQSIPPFVAYGEHISRVLIFMLTLLMPLNISTLPQKRGLILYTVGTIMYFASWLALIYFPDSSWSSHILGFMAPAYTPLVWLTGIGLIGNSFYFKLPYRRWIFMSTAIIFLLFHNFHAMIVYFSNH